MTAPDARPAPRTVVLVEGRSDVAAVRALATRCGRDLDAEGVSVVSIGGAQAIARSVAWFGPRGLGARLAGLCDAGEEAHYRRAVERAGLGTPMTRADMERLGFFVCDADLEDELIRALGPEAVERIVESQGELAALRTFRRQPAWRGRAPADQLRRFIGTHSGRKIAYGALLVEALDPRRVPAPLAGLLAYV